MLIPQRMTYASSVLNICVDTGHLGAG